MQRPGQSLEDKRAPKQEQKKIEECTKFCEKYNKSTMQESCLKTAFENLITKPACVLFVSA